MSNKTIKFRDISIWQGTVVSLVLLSWINMSAAATCNVPGTYATIQSAVDDPACTEIQLTAGIFSDTTVIDRDLTIGGVGRNILNPVSRIRGTITVGVAPNINPVILTIRDLIIDFTGAAGILLASKKAQVNGDDIEISFNSVGVDFQPTADDSTVNLSNCDVSDNLHGINALRIDLNNCRVMLNNTFGGVKVGLGGAIVNSQIFNNTHTGSTGDGAGILFDGPGGTLLTITGSTISGNSALGNNPSNNTSDGGGIMVRAGILQLTGSEVFGNLAGRFGGGIASSNLFGSNTTITDTTVSGNFAYDSGGGIGAADRTTIINSVIENNQALHNASINDNGLSAGGGIYAWGDTLTITDTSLHGNSAIAQINGIGLGGGAYFSVSTGRSADLTRVTLSDNFAFTDGGGIYANANGSVTLFNTTIANNRTNGNGGGVFANSNVAIQHSTIIGNIADDDNNNAGDGGGLFGNATLVYSLTGDNIDKSASPNYQPDCSGAITSLEYSIIGVVNGCAASFNSGPGNQNGTTPSPLGIEVAPLADNGGSTLTVAPGLNSPALDGGTASCATLATDQRGHTRVSMDGNNDGGADGDFCDIGAFETFSTGCQVVEVVVTEYAYAGPSQENILSKSNIKTVGNVSVESTADVYFAAGTSIDLGSGFLVETGGQLLAEVTSVGCP